MQIEYGLIAVFFLSNFAPDRKFVQHFNDTFSNFYAVEKINLEPNYRFEVLAYLSAFNLKAETKYRHPAGSKVFRATITIGNAKDALRFVCEDKDKEFVNKELWRIAYEKLLAPVTFFAGFGILFADNFSHMAPNVCSKIMRQLRLYADARTVAAF